MSHALLYLGVKAKGMQLKNALFDQNQDFLFIIDKKGLIKETNTSFIRFLGCKEDEVVKNNFLKFIHKDDLLPAKMFLEAFDRRQDSCQQLLRFKNSEDQYVQFNFILKYKSKSSYMLQAIDLLVLHRSESDRFINEHVLYLILDLVPYPVFVKNSKSEYILLNQAQAGLFGLSVEQMLGKTDDDLVKDEEELKMVRKSDSQVLESLEKITLDEQIFSTPNGNRYVLQTTKVPFINAITSEKNILGISIDYTARKAAEAELMKTNFELDSFVYRASHDLKAPLRSVMGLVNLLQLDKSTKNQEECISRIEASIFRLDEFIKELTNYSRNARLDVSRQIVDIEEVVFQILDNLKYLDPQNKISVDIHIGNKSVLYSDRHRLQVILQNLLSNAIKYQNPKNDQPHIKIKGEIFEDYASIDITDNGIGIGKEFHDGVFKMFYRATELSEGSGLGLYIAKQSIEKLGGDISFKSSKDEGTVFNLKFKNLLKEE